MSQINNTNEGGTFVRYLVILSVVVATGLMALSVATFSSGPGVQTNFKSGDSETGYQISSVYSSLSKSEKKSLFSDFKMQFGREYKNDDEEAERYTNFEAFLALIDARNSVEIANGGTSIHGITKFADISDEEFRSNFLGFKLEGDLKTAMKDAKNGDDYAVSHGFTSSDTVVNWAGVQTTPVKNQGYCGSCWAFSATEQIESDSIKAGYLDATQEDALSPQQIVSCDTYDSYGCDGGLTIYAYYYVYKTGGLQTNASYPYTSYYDVDGTCVSDSDDYEVTVDDYYYLSSEDSMESHVLTYGPLSVCLDASTWASYTNGTMTTCGTDVDHCVQAVGINSDDDYWVVRNSWGTDWGQEGYIYLKSGENLCDITYIPTFTTVTKV